MCSLFVLSKGESNLGRNLKLKYVAIEWLQRRGVSLEDIAKLVLDVQKNYVKNLKFEDCLECVERVIEKREVQNVIFTGITLDELAENGYIQEPLVGMLKRDDGLYGVDEIMGLGIVNVYGSIGLTNFGYLDKIKPGIIGKLNKSHLEGMVNAFLDDIIAAIAAAAAARMAHRYKDAESTESPA